MVHAFLRGEVSAACRYTNCIVASRGFLPMRQRLITGGKQRLSFMKLGPCSGEDRDKLGVHTPVVPLGGRLQQTGFKCVYFRGLFFLCSRKSFLRRLSGYRTIMSPICISKSM